ncbi:MAG: nucleoside hydrolase [Leptolyngbyaceae cyanobacterium MO_188.B28]|nr:nucleoside hydrolase [Leptolyngbyaceae cyanobacterium MO_188.B28]
MAPRPIIIDCDPGVDDAIALLLALASTNELTVLGVTTVAGNAPLSLTQKNARKICQLAGRLDVNVYAGCPRPLLQPLVTAEHVHGETGLQGADLPEPTLALQPQHGVSFLIDALTQAAEKITLATLGPLTNIAVALIQQPQLIENIEEIVVMGGAITHGNVTPSAEFNIYVDPHAAQVVMGSGAPITLISLDVTHQVLTTTERLAAIRALGSPVGQAAADMLAYYGTEDVDRYGLPGAPLHDPCVIAYLLQPTLYSHRQAYVEVDLASPLTLGRTVVDFWGGSGRPANAKVMLTIDANGLYQLLIDRIGKL